MRAPFPAVPHRAGSPGAEGEDPSTKRLASLPPGDPCAHAAFLSSLSADGDRSSEARLRGSVARAVAKRVTWVSSELVDVMARDTPAAALLAAHPSVDPGLGARLLETALRHQPLDVALEVFLVLCWRGALQLHPGKLREWGDGVMWRHVLSSGVSSEASYGSFSNHIRRLERGLKGGMDDRAIFGEVLQSQTQAGVGPTGIHPILEHPQTRPETVEHILDTAPGMDTAVSLAMSLDSYGAATWMSRPRVRKALRQAAQTSWVAWVWLLNGTSADEVGALLREIQAHDPQQFVAVLLHPKLPADILAALSTSELQELLESPHPNVRAKTLRALGVTRASRHPTPA